MVPNSRVSRLWQAIRRWPLGVHLLLAVNVPLGLLLTVLMVFEYRDEMNQAILEKEAGLADEAIAVHQAVSHLSNDHSAKSAQEFIERVCAKMQETRSPGHAILVSRGGDVLHSSEHGHITADADSEQDAEQMTRTLQCLGLPEELCEKLAAKGSMTMNLIPIIAPQDGVIVEMDVVAGEVVQPEKALLTLANLSRMWLTLHVTQEDADRLSLGQTVKFQTDGGKREIAGRLSFISPSVDEQTRTISLLSLGAIDFGMVVDSSVVMVENCIRHIAHGDNKRRPLIDVIRDAAVEVRRPTMFGELIIMIVYTPILTLEGIEGKLFRPMALTVIFALLGSMVLSLTLMPVLASLILPKEIEEREPLLMRIAHAIHYPVLHFSMHHKTAVIAFALAVLAVTYGLIAPNLGSEFVPRLSEGSIVVAVVRLAGTDLEESVRGNTAMEQIILKNFPDEVQHVFSRIDTAEIATDPMGVELTDIFITLKPRTQWKKATTQTELTELLEEKLKDLSGQKISFSQPIEMRMAEMVSGSRSDLAVKLFGDDFAVLTAKAAEIEAVLKTIPGNADVNTEQVTGQPSLQIDVDQDQIARYGVQARKVLELIESVGTLPLNEVIEGQSRFPLIIRVPERLRQSPETIGSMLISTPTGERIPLSRLAKIEVVEGPSTITREWGQRRITVSANVRGRDLGSFVADAQRLLAEKITLTHGLQAPRNDRSTSRDPLPVAPGSGYSCARQHVAHHNIAGHAKTLGTVYRGIRPDMVPDTNGTVACVSGDWFVSC